MAWLTFDIDRPGAAHDWYDRALPPPTLVMANPRNGHAHLAYALTNPIPRSDISRIKPLQYMAAVSEGIRAQVGADLGYRGGLVKTPGHPAWQTASYAGAYSLSELADWVTPVSPRSLLKLARDGEYAGLGRNCLLFELLRTDAYKMWRRLAGSGFEVFRVQLELRAAELAGESSPRDPLPANEVRTIARSVARWVWRRFSASGFASYQSAVGSLKGKALREEKMPEVLRLIGEGKSQREVATIVEVNHATISRWLRR